MVLFIKNDQEIQLLQLTNKDHWQVKIEQGDDLILKVEKEENESVYLIERGDHLKRKYGLQENEIITIFQEVIEEVKNRIFNETIIRYIDFWMLIKESLDCLLVHKLDTFN